MLIHVSLGQIDDNPFQRRTEYGDISELARDIFSHKQNRPDTMGLQQVPNGRLVGDDGYPIPGSGLDDEDMYDEDGYLCQHIRIQLEFGHRRKRAFEHLAQTYPGFYRMPVYIRDLDDDAMLDGVWSENRQRRNLSSVEEAELLAIKLEQSASQREVAEEWGLQRSTVANRLRLLKLPESVRNANRQGVLSERQCLSLATAVQLDDLLDGDDIGWGTAVQPGWGVPVEPRTYIQYVIDNPTTTSEDIRSITKRMLSHAGVGLPKTIASFASEEAEAYDDGEIIQPLCKGCPLRINNHCLDASCVETKMTWFAGETLKTVAAELELPVSDEDAHFEYSYDFRNALEGYWEAGGRENLVIGWRGGSGARPFTDSYYVHGDRDKFGGDGRAAITLGHTTGSLPDAPGDEPEDIADAAQVDAWRTRAGKILSQARKTAKEALSEALYETINDYQPLMALAQKPDVEGTDDASELNSAFLEFMWKRGLWLSYAPASFTEEWEFIGGMLERAGIGRAILRDDDRAADLSQRAVMWLSYWYYYRNHHYANERMEKARVNIDGLRGEFERVEFLAGDLLDLSYELDRAARDIAAQMAR